MAFDTSRAASLSSLPASARAKYVEGEILVRFKANANAVAQTRAVSAVGVHILSSPQGAQRIRLNADQDVPTAISVLQSDPAVEYVQPNYLYYAAAVPNDPNYAALWGLKNNGQTIPESFYSIANPGTPGRDIAAEAAWDIISDCRTTVVAVLDTGIDYTHQDLAANMWDGSTSYPNHGWDAVGNDNAPRPEGALEHHGTHVAGIIAAVGNNNRGVTGVCWQAQLMAVRVLNEDGVATTADIIVAIDFATDHGAKVINMSLAGEVPYDPAYAEAITYARNQDVVVVAAGNTERRRDRHAAAGLQS